MPDSMITDRPLVSVITVTYNSSLYVRDAIESVLAQTYTNIEYIIGDDCSIDNTWDIICSYNDARIKKYRNKTNIGEYPNRNTAIGMSTGKFIIFIDGDDLIYNHGIEIYLRYANMFPDAGMTIQKKEFNNVVFPYLFEPRDILLNFFNGINILESSFGSNFYKARILKQYMLPESFIQGDAFIRLKMSCRNSTLIIPGSLTWIRETPGQASSKLNGYTGVVDEIHLIKEIIENDISNCLNSEEIESIYYALYNRNKKVALLNLLKGNISIFIQVIKYVFYLKAKIKNKHSIKNFDFLNLKYFGPQNPLKLINKEKIFP